MWNPFSSNALSTLGKASKNAGRQIHGFPLAGYQGQKYQINNLFHNNHGIYKVYIGETNVHKMLILCKSNL